MKRSVYLFTAVVIAVHALAANPTRLEIVGPGTTRRLSADEIGALPRVEVTISDHGVKATFEGTPLSNLLALVNAPSGEHLRGGELTRYVLVEAADSYSAVFALAELDHAFTDRVVLLADRRDGKPLSASEGPFRLIVEGEKRQARCVRQVTRISLRNAK